MATAAASLAGVAPRLRSHRPRNARCSARASTSTSVDMVFEPVGQKSQALVQYTRSCNLHHNHLHLLYLHHHTPLPSLNQTFRYHILAA